MTENSVAHIPAKWSGHPNDPNAPSFGPWECSCGADHFTTFDGRYPLAHAGGKFVEECAVPECGKRCCHECAAVCRICGCAYCPDHQKGFDQELSLCENCSAYYSAFAGHQKPKDVERLIELERRRARHPNSFYGTLTESETGWLILSLKEAWEALAEIHSERRDAA